MSMTQPSNKTEAYIFINVMPDFCLFNYLRTPFVREISYSRVMEKAQTQNTYQWADERASNGLITYPQSLEEEDTPLHPEPHGNCTQEQTA